LLPVEETGLSRTLRNKRTMLPLAAVLIGAGGGFAQILVQYLNFGQEHARAYVPGWDLDWVLSGLRTVAAGFIPLPDPTDFHTWNSSFLALLPGSAGQWLGALLGAGLLLFCAWCLWRPRPVLLVFLLGSAAMLTVTFFFWFGYMRHHGQPFVWFLVCCWLGRVLATNGPPERAGAHTNGASARRRHCANALTALLLVQLVASGYAMRQDLIHPFSNATVTGRALAADEFADATLVGSVDYAVQPICAFIDRPFFYPESGRFGTFIDWGPGRDLVSPQLVLQEALELLEREQQDVVMVLSYPPLMTPGQTLPVGDRVEMTYVRRFVGALVPDENYHLYRLSRTD